MNTNARSRLLDTGRVLSFRFSQPSVRAGSPCDRSLSHSRGGYFVANETPGSRAGCPVRDNPPTWVESQSGRSCRARPPSLTEVKMHGQLICVLTNMPIIIFTVVKLLCGFSYAL